MNAQIARTGSVNSPRRSRTTHKAPGAVDPDLGAELVAEVPTAVRRVAGWTARGRAKRAEACADLIASGADALWATDPASAARAAEVREALVTGLAILALRPGGVNFAGMVWDSDLPGSAVSLLPDTWTILAPVVTGADRGAVFTPRELADDVVRNALGVIVAERQAPDGLDIESLRVADIACGSGAFLVAAARYLAAALTDEWKHEHEDRDHALEHYGTQDAAAAARAHVITHCIYGVDIDPLSVELAAVALQLLAPTFRPAGGRLRSLRVGDALAGLAPSSTSRPPSVPVTTQAVHWSQAFPEVFAAEPGKVIGFDAVVGNPPFIGGLKLSGRYGQAYREHLVAAIANRRRGTADLAVYFWLRAHQLVLRHGVVAIVGPAALLRGTNARVGREQLARDGWHPYREVNNIRWPTTTAAISCCLVWTHCLADPSDTFRNLPDERPLGDYAGTVDIDGVSVDLYRYIPTWS